MPTQSERRAILCGKPTDEDREAVRRFSGFLARSGRRNPIEMLFDGDAELTHPDFVQREQYGVRNGKLYAIAEPVRVHSTAGDDVGTATVWHLIGELP